MPSLSSFKNKKEYLKYYKLYREKNAEKFREYWRTYRKKWRLKNGMVKDNARKILNDAVFYSQIDRGICEVCGGKKNIEGHHKDYQKPLEVVWLCRKHHKDLHKIIKK